MKNKIDVIILCGGLGKRLYPVLTDRPKSMALISKKPFLYYLIKQIQKFGFAKVIFCVGYKSEFIINHFSNNKFDIDIQYSIENEPLGTGGAIKLALTKVSSDYILVMNGDSYIDVNLNDFCSWCKQNKFVSSILLTEIEDVSRYGSVKIDSNARITSFLEKGEYSGKGLINTGVYLFKKEMLTLIPTKAKYSLEKQFFPMLVEQKKLYGKIVRDKFIDIGTPDSYKKAHLFFKQVLNTIN